MQIVKNIFSNAEMFMNLSSKLLSEYTQVADLDL
jgi:hypothetical protein